MDFFEELCSVLRRDAKKYSGVNVSTEEWLKFNEKLDLNNIEISETIESSTARRKLSSQLKVDDPEYNTGCIPEKSAHLNYQGLCEQVTNCSRCSARNNCEVPLFGSGSSSAELMFVYDAPTVMECSNKCNIDGDAGKLFEKIVSAMGYKKDEVYVTTIVKCPVLSGVDNLKFNECIGYLRHQIALIKPRAIVIFGASATRLLLGRQRPVLELLGKWGYVMGVPALPTYNPAFLLTHEDKKRQAWRDLQLVMAKLGRSYK